jgi:hypothetical protein
VAPKRRKRDLPDGWERLPGGHGYVCSSSGARCKNRQVLDTLLDAPLPTDDVAMDQVTPPTRKRPRASVKKEQPSKEYLQHVRDGQLTLAEVEKDHPQVAQLSQLDVSKGLYLYARPLLQLDGLDGAVVHIEESDLRCAVDVGSKKTLTSVPVHWVANAPDDVTLPTRYDTLGCFCTDVRTKKGTFKEGDRSGGCNSKLQFSISPDAPSVYLDLVEAYISVMLGCNK